jgi:hypothetical protein
VCAVSGFHRRNFAGMIQQFLRIGKIAGFSVRAARENHKSLPAIRPRHDIELTRASYACSE